ncbi:WXG100 family type VII secretion target [Agreia pratensis]|uniref:WXG100 family type VII secretion target n=1 Tax=Agreia pratensis TaxID=150121 RepID=A0A1X7K6H0_9MICO|nr:hypothetical protein [Agreia pratensis]SMG36358.1 hypothetical protein SAMN06296010_2145 [Agreia pratensis]
MTSGMWGADTTELRALARSMDSAAQQLGGIASSLTSQINGVGAWVGPDAEGFRSQWNATLRKSIVSANDVLLSAATALLKNARDQEETSSVDGAAPGSSTAPNSPGHTGAPGSGQQQHNPLADILDNPALVATEGVFNDIDALGFLSDVAKLRLGASFDSLDGALGFSRFERGFGALNEFLHGENWGAATQRLSTVLGDGALASNVGSAAEFLGKAGKVLGPVGAVLGVAGVANDIVKKDYGRAAYDGVATGLGIAALVTPPPVDFALGVAAGGMALGSLLYDDVPLVHDVVDNTTAAIGDAANATGKAIGAGAEAVAHGAEDFAEGVAETAKKFWPFG